MWALAAARGSWVTITMVLWKSRLRVSMRPRISSALFASRSPVGSSATSTCGSVTTARAMATRCSWPPESWRGKWPERSARPTTLRAVRARSRRSFFESDVSSSGSSTFSTADSTGIRL